MDPVRFDARPLGQDVVTFADVRSWVVALRQRDWMHHVHGLVTVRANCS